MTLGRLATQSVLIVSALLIPRVLGVKPFGAYAAVMAVVVVAETVASGGLHLADIRYFGSAYWAGEPNAVRVGSTIWVARLALAGLAGGAAAIWIATTTSGEIETAVILAVGLIVVARAALEASRHPLLVIGRTGTMAAFETSRAAVTLVVAVGLFGIVGLTGVFVGLGVAMAVLAVLAAFLLRRTTGFSLGHFRWSILNQIAPFSALTLFGLVAWVLQAHFAVIAVANWLSLSDAAVLGLTIQLYVMAQTATISPWAAVLPHLAAFHAVGQLERVREWSSIVMRYGAFVGVLIVAAWASVGDSILRFLPEEFGAVHESGSIALAAVAVLSVAVAANNVLYIGGSPGLGSTNVMVFAATTILGTILAINSPTLDVATSIPMVYLVAAVVYALLAYSLLVRRYRIWLPLRRTVMIMTPLALIWPVIGWEQNGWIKGLAFLAFCAVYVPAVIALRLMPWDELKRVLATVRSPSTANNDSI